ncbi:MAG: efflux RND transporter periplasmic adaptor subunit [Pirellulaceae bacterium]
MSGQQSSVNAETIEQTKQQIRSLVSEISQLSKSEITAEEYHAAFLQRIVSALAAVGGAIWLASEGRRMELAYQINLSESLLDSSSDDATRHLRLLDYVVHTNEGALVPPLSGGADEAAGGNPTDFLLVLCPLRGDGKVEGLVEIFQRSDSPPATQRGYLRFLEQMCELASEWLKTQKLRQFSDRHSLWAQADQFSRIVHESLDQRETAYAIANEGRRLIGCDRVSVGVMRGRKCVIEALSGQDALEHRSNVVAALSRLATKVVATGEPLRYEGSTEDFPPQIETAIEEYVDESYARSMEVLPLRRPRLDDSPASEASTGHVEREQDHVGDVIGALIIEQIEVDLPRNIMDPRVDLVYEHSTRALANASDHSNLFLMPVWRALGKAAWIVRARTLPKTLAVTGLLLLVLGVLIFVKKDFNLKANGELQPVVKQDVFVPVGGTVEELKVKDWEPVEEDQILVQLKNTDLEVQFADISGKLKATQEQLNSATDTVHRRASVLTEDEKVRLFGQVAELKAQEQSLTLQRDLVKHKLGRLIVRSPIAGRVMLSWDVARSLENRTVEVGQVLMSVASPDDDWELELFMPERRMGHIDRARLPAGDDGLPEVLTVSYILATDPNNSREGRVKQVERITQVRDDEGNTVRIRVDIDQDEVRNPRPGASVTAKVLCGRRAIGYTWFHEAFEWLQAHVLF